ncbi:MAG: TonB-dependent receptor [Bacteroidales bacterium]|nr:TonB-dependent receptor [Bacteroidales bacterium]
MRKLLPSMILSIVFAFYAPYLKAQEVVKDTIINNYRIEELTFVSTPKETYFLNQLPASATILNKTEAESSGRNSIKGLSGVISNLYIPDYGSKITSAVYIRGIGSRFSPAPSVGLYVDNVPYIDKSAFDFEFLDIERIEVLRGPQGTLYGRNALGGIVHVRTKSPFSTPGSTITLSAGSYGQYRGTFTTNHKLSEKAAFSLGGFYSHQDGFFTNSFTSLKADKGYSAGGRIKLAYYITPSWKAEANAHMEKSNQNAYPYGTYNKTTGVTSNPNYNDSSSYKRLLSTNSLVITHTAPKWKLSLISSYQYLNDTMKLDQDFSPASIYTMSQSQNMHNLSQEAIFKSENNKNYQFVSGVSGFYQKNFTNAPVLFGTDGVQRFFQSTFDRLYTSGAMPFRMTVTNPVLPVAGEYDMHSFGFAAFHQVVLKRVFTEGLSLTLGLRYEYEKQYLDYMSTMSLSLRFNMPNVPVPVNTTIPAVVEGKENQDFGQFLPKIALQYNFNENHRLFFTSARGYKAGGYNIQMFSDLVQSKLMGGMPGSGGSAPASDIEKTISYRPEYNWNNEIGYSGEVIQNKLSLSGALFYISSKDQQVVQFAGTSGFGRVARNAGKSYSTGAELSVKYKIISNLEANFNYGYTYSKFTEYTDNQNDYSGKFVPFVPQNTVSLFLLYSKALSGKFIDKFSISAQYNGAGKIYWTDKNDVIQDFYSTLDIGGSINFSIFEVGIWLRNATNSRYNTFYFETLGTGIAQLNRPLNFGTDIKIRF